MVLNACTSKQNKDYLKPVKIVKLNISEPSGITYFKHHLYIVSDQNGTVYKTSLDGKIQRKIKTKLSDLEGITVGNKANEFWLVNEGSRKLVRIDSLGNKIAKYKIKGKQKHKNSGLEGVCFDEIGALYLVNEKSPKELLKLNLEGEIESAIELEFSKDISGVSFDKKSNSFWFVSDESKAIYNVNKRGELLNKYNIPVDKAEGITVVDDNLYIVSDSSNELYVFRLPK
jgi:uncharacterized protein YjiK